MLAEAKPIDIPTADTVAFVASCVPSGATFIEVGCGEGNVTVELVTQGYDGVGIDSDAEVVSRARRSGANVVHASWPDFDGGPVDAVIFTRSLHHVSRLSESIAKSAEVLKPTGALLIEDFAYDEVSPAAIEWLLTVIGSANGRALISLVPGEFVSDLYNAKDKAATWQRNHDHDLHTMADMTEAIAEEFVIREVFPVPYLYRYLVPVLPETTKATAFIRGIFEEETRLGLVGDLKLIGRRIVSVKRQLGTT